MAAKYDNVARIVFSGDDKIAATLEGEARVLMGEMLEFMDYGELKYENRTHKRQERRELLVRVETVSTELGNVEIKYFDLGYDAEIKLKANLIGEVPIIEIEIDVTPFTHIETSKSDFRQAWFSVAFEGLYGQVPAGFSETVEFGPLLNPDGTPFLDHEDNAINIVAKRDKIKPTQYIWYGGMLMIPPEKQSNEILTFDEQNTWVYDETDLDNLNEIIFRYSYVPAAIENGDFFNFDENTGNDFGVPWARSKALIMSMHEDDVGFKDTPGFGQFLSYYETFTDYGATTLTFNYYPELKEKLGQRGDVGMMVYPIHVEDKLDIKKVEDNHHIIGYDINYDNQTPFKVGSIPELDIKGEIADGWYTILYKETDATNIFVSSLTEQENPVFGIQIGGFIQNVCVTLGGFVESFPLLHTRSSLIREAAKNRYMLKAVTLINPKEGIVHHYTGAEGDIVSELFDMAESPYVTRKPGVRPESVLSKFKPTFSKYWFADLM